MRAFIATNNHAINMGTDSTCGFSLHVTTKAVGPYHYPSQEEYAAYVVCPAGFGDKANAGQGGGQAALEEAMEEDVVHDSDGDEGH